MIKKIYNNHRETIHNLFWRGLQTFGKQGIIFLIFILCAKMLSPYDFGIYNYILAIIFLLVMLGDFGISTATSKYVAEYNLTNKEKLKSVLFNSGIIILGLTLIITIITLMVGPYYLKEKYIYLIWLLPLIFLAPMTSLYDGIYRGLKKFKELAIISLIVGFISLFFVYFLIKGYGLMGALISQIIFYLILVIGLALGHKEFHFKFNKEVIKEVGKYSLIYGLAVIGYYLFTRINILILGYYNYIEPIATYELLDKIFLLLIVPFTLLGQVIAPNFTELNIKKKYFKIYSKLKKYTFYFFLIGIILGGGLYFILPIIIKNFFLNYYNNLFFQIFPFIVFIFITKVWATTIDSGILVPTGYAHLMTKFYLILGAFGIILSLILVNLLGYMGIIYSLTICSILMAVGMRGLFLIKLKKLIKINS